MSCLNSRVRKNKKQQPYNYTTEGLVSPAGLSPSLCENDHVHSLPYNSDMLIFINNNLYITQFNKSINHCNSFIFIYSYIFDVFSFRVRFFINLDTISRINLE